MVRLEGGVWVVRLTGGGLGGETDWRGVWVVRLTGGGSGW